MKNILIIGAGASGMICAIEASKNINNHITIIDKNSVLGKKLLITGNGKCNFTNLEFDKDNLGKYYNNTIVKDVFDRFDNIDLIKYFENLGILSYQFDRGNNKYIYPLTNKSKDVLNIFKIHLNKTNINILLNKKIIDIYFNKKFLVKTSDENIFEYDYVVLATGGLSGFVDDEPKNTHYFSDKLNLKLIKPLSGLCALKSDDFLISGIKSFRSFCKISLFINDEIKKTESGEIQFNNHYLSGIPIFQVSSIAARALDMNKNVSVSIDFLDMSYNTNKNSKEFLLSKINKLADYTVYNFLLGIVNEQLIYKYIKILNINNEKTIKNLNSVELEKLINLLLNYRLKILDTQTFKDAQITLGGIDISEINIKNFMSKKIKNLFLVGEILDIDGICGGYNLQFAFSSGYLCGNFLRND